MTSDVQDAERDVASSKQRFQESLRLAGESGTRLAVEVKKSVTPTLLVAVGIGAVAVAVGLVLRSNTRSRRLASQRASLSGNLARAAGGWLLRAIATRVAVQVATSLRDANAVALPSDR